MKDNSFEYRRVVSEQNSLDPLWIEFYKAFARIKDSELEYMEFNCEGDTSIMENYPFPKDQLNFIYDVELQKRGYDKRIMFQDGSSFIIEEKVRYENYGDVFVERWEDKRVGKVGWGWDPEMLCDYLAYAIWPASLCIFINFRQLQTLLIENEDVYMRRRQFENAEGGYLSTGFTLSFKEIHTHIPDSLFLKKSQRRSSVYA